MSQNLSFGGILKNLSQLDWKDFGTKHAAVGLSAALVIGGVWGILSYNKTVPYSIPDYAYSDEYQEEKERIERLRKAIHRPKNKRTTSTESHKASSLKFGVKSYEKKEKKGHDIQRSDKIEDKQIDHYTHESKQTELQLQEKLLISPGEVYYVKHAFDLMNIDNKQNVNVSVNTNELEHGHGDDNENKYDYKTENDNEEEEAVGFSADVHYVPLQIRYQHTKRDLDGYDLPTNIH
ncbi:hypothetical protein RFI_02313 [Reticulomyxa filosa]|uniref:Uncharacterized protein n=1 Tax=Reticulomyxa filosa TaxID=46433 RepID=X6PAW1_RETFI|nr:hypothetical protein RFI_02313 [Reticulomyxa filosa]|eukprot:ETO34777.1 hypothetical protein RFI_02313 [Reticulomyxa filosa]